MSRRVSLRLDWLHGNVRDLRKSYERACGVSLHRFHGWRTVFANRQRIRILLHDRENASDCAIVYFHGGGWIVGSPATHADLSRALSVYTDLPVISVDYRLAPEHKAAAAVADGLDVLHDFLSPIAASSNLQSAILCGDSAGGSVAMAVERGASLDLKKKVLGVASFYGCFGRQLSRPLQQYGRREDGLDARCLDRYWAAANSSHGRGEYTLSALDHVPGSPVYLLIAGRDPLRDHSLALAHALDKRGRAVTVDLHRFEGHGFLQQPHRYRAVDLALRRFSQWVHDRRFTEVPEAPAHATLDLFGVTGTCTAGSAR
jgi:acetyl esterase